MQVYLSKIKSYVSGDWHPMPVIWTIVKIELRLIIIGIEDSLKLFKIKIKLFKLY